MKLRMIQRSQVNWQIEAPNGYIVYKDITIANTHDAEQFVKNYVSSFTNWSYEVVPMQRKGVKNEQQR